MQSITAKLAALGAVCALSACSTVTVSTDYDRSASFGSYKTYTLAPPAQGQMMSPTSEEALRSSLRSELAARGIVEATQGKGDLAIVRHVFADDVIAIQQYTNWGYGYGGGWPYRYGTYGVWSGAPTTYTDVSQYTEGTLVLDAVDTRTNKLVFRGEGRAVLDGPDSNAGKIREAVKKMVAAVPR